MRRPLETLDEDVEQLLRCLWRLPDVERNMRQLLPTLRAQAYDTERAGSVVWCDYHERTVNECHRRNEPCEGVPLPKHVDPTGDDTEAMNVLSDAREARRHMHAVHAAAGFLTALVRRYDPAVLLPDEATEVERNNEPKCERHMRYGFDVPSRTRGGTRVKRSDGTHVLADPRKLCQWCEDATRTLGRLPNEREVKDNAAGKRLRVSA